MIYETRTSSLVKTVIYRVWVLITGQSIESAVVPTVIINLVWIMSFYFYHRVWARITWGRLQLFHLYRLLLRFFATQLAFWALCCDHLRHSSSTVAKKLQARFFLSQHPFGSYKY